MNLMELEGRLWNHCLTPKERVEFDMQKFGDMIRHVGREDVVAYSVMMILDVIWDREDG